MKNKYLLLFPILLTSCFSGGQDIIEEINTSKNVQTQIIKPESFSQNLKFIGKISSSKESSISPLTSGIVKEIKVNIGDTVKAGDILAIIDSSSNGANIAVNNAQNAYSNTLNIYSATKEALEKSLETASLQLENAKISKENTFSTTQKQLELAQNQLKAIEIQEENAQKTSQSSWELSEKNLETAKINLENFEKSYSDNIKSLENKQKTLYDNMRVSLEGGLVNIYNALEATDVILGVTNKNRHLNDGYEIYLGAKNSSLKSGGENLLQKSLSSYEILNNKYSKDFSQEQLEDFFDEFLVFVDDVNDLFTQMNLIFDNSISSSSLSEMMISNFKQANSGYQGQAINLKNNLLTLKNSLGDIKITLENTHSQAQSQKATLNQAINIAQASLENTILQTNSNLDNLATSKDSTKLQLENTLSTIEAQRETAENALKIAQNQYESAKANYNSQLAQVKSQLDGAGGQANSASLQLENAYIKAPFDGIITSKNIEVGSMIGTGNPAFILNATDGKKIKGDISGENMKYLIPGQDVIIEVKGEKYEGKIASLGTTMEQKTRLYPIEIYFNDGQDLSSLIIGDFGNIFALKNIEDEQTAFLIPFSALIVEGNEQYSVFIVDENNKAQRRKITLGESNESKILVLSGLKSGEKIIISGALDVFEGDSVKEISQ